MLLEHLSLLPAVHLGSSAGSACCPCGSRKVTQEFQNLSLAWPKPGCRWHLEIEPVDGRSVSAPTLSLVSAFGVPVGISCDNHICFNAMGAPILPSCELLTYPCKGGACVGSPGIIQLYDSFLLSMVSLLCGFCNLSSTKF